MMGRPVQHLLLLGIVMLFTLSSNMLYVMGINYSASNASYLLKIHPSSYVFFFLILISPSITSSPRRPELKRCGLLLIMVSTVSLVLYQFFSVEAGGGESSLLIVTYAATGALAVALSYADTITLRQMKRFVSLFLLCNSLIGIAETSGFPRILPYVVGETIIGFDDRPTALLGHPLNNALITGAWCLVILLSNFRTPLNFWRLTVLGVHLIALLAFGGRAAVVVAALSYTCFVAYQATTTFLKGDSRDIIRLAKLCIIAGAGVPVLIYSGAADTVIERFLDSRGSDETRSAALVMLDLLSPGQWLFGVPVSVRTSIQALLGSTRGIEISWLALVYSFGLPITAILLVATYLTLRATTEDHDMGRAALLFYFFLTTLLSLSIGSKSLLVAQFLVILACFAKPLEAPPLIHAGTKSRRPNFGDARSIGI
ncbi:VpsF family polysaccharide biosynthesis protein [uncultured Agrobacterium sp.]|uniref:VpsF family polysaccharide biosynthesis protein n=1 Tax=uncultured Agrobacterium sp. TaxID=157277 RepID=UPI0025D76B79|nr:VpsF family polysaccharide biosynthesis protein [uncultured Agrobacterium sp.]